MVIIFQWCCTRRDTDSCACVHTQVNVSAVTANMLKQLKLACTHETPQKLSYFPVWHIMDMLCGIVHSLIVNNSRHIKQQLALFGCEVLNI